MTISIPVSPNGVMTRQRNSQISDVMQFSSVGQDSPSSPSSPSSIGTFGTLKFDRSGSNAFGALGLGRSGSILSVDSLNSISPKTFVKNESRPSRFFSQDYETLSTFSPKSSNCGDNSPSPSSSPWSGSVNSQNLGGTWDSAFNSKDSINVYIAKEGPKQTMFEQPVRLSVVGEAENDDTTMKSGKNRLPHHLDLLAINNNQIADNSAEEDNRESRKSIILFPKIMVTSPTGAQTPINTMSPKQKKKLERKSFARQSLAEKVDRSSAPAGAQDHPLDSPQHPSTPGRSKKNLISKLRSLTPRRSVSSRPPTRFTTARPETWPTREEKKPKQKDIERLKDETMKQILAEAENGSVNGKIIISASFFRTKYEYPLHMAVRRNRPVLIESLLNAGADPRTRNSARETPEELYYSLSRRRKMSRDVLAALQTKKVCPRE